MAETILNSESSDSPGDILTCCLARLFIWKSKPYIKQAKKQKSCFIKVNFPSTLFHKNLWMVQGSVYGWSKSSGPLLSDLFPRAEQSLPGVGGLPSAHGLPCPPGLQQTRLQHHNVWKAVQHATNKNCNTGQSVLLAADSATHPRIVKNLFHAVNKTKTKNCNCETKNGTKPCLQGRCPEKNMLSLGLCPNEGGEGPTQIFGNFSKVHF